MNTPTLQVRISDRHIARTPTQLPLFRFDDLPDDALIRQRELLAYSAIPFSASTLWRKIRAKSFPTPVRVSTAITAFRVREVREWLANPAGYEVGGAK
jgi:prophage regulatory protein